VEGACAELRAVGSGQATRIERLRAIVAELARSAEASALEGLRVGVAHVDDREFLHGLAVALSTLRLARALGIGGKALEDLVLSGFLHDVGHVAAGAVADLGLSRSLHPVRGAVLLAALEGMPDEAVLVAFDHHLRFDGTPSYPSLAVPRRPVAAARVVAVADAWETLRAQGATRPAEALELLRGRAGTFLDPALVELFGELVTSSRSGNPRSTP
jgi:HD-GYP domain-containing protein (c-di-GMP phosphodiesterase class II)